MSNQEALYSLCLQLRTKVSGDVFESRESILIQASLRVFSKSTWPDLSHSSLFVHAETFSALKTSGVAQRSVWICLVDVFSALLSSNRAAEIPGKGRICYITGVSKLGQCFHLHRRVASLPSCEEDA